MRSRRLALPADPRPRAATCSLRWWGTSTGGPPNSSALPRSAPLPRRLVEQAIALGRDFVADPASTGTLIHGDLHYENVLAADREPWLVIDPKPVNGDPHYEIAPMLWNRWDELAGDTRDGVRRRFHTLVDAAGLADDRARAWVVVADGPQRDVGAERRRRARPGLADHVRGHRQGRAGLSPPDRARTQTRRGNCPAISGAILSAM